LEDGKGGQKGTLTMGQKRQIIFPSPDDLKRRELTIVGEVGGEELKEKKNARTRTPKTCPLRRLPPNDHTLGEKNRCLFEERKWR